LCFCFVFSAKNLQDAASWGARQEQDQDRDDEEGEKMPAIKGPLRKKAKKEEIEDVEDVDEPEDEVAILANHLKSTGIDLETWHSIDRTPDSYVRYVFIRIEFVGSTTSGKINAAIVDDGNAVEVEVKISRGGELTNPDHLLTMYGDQIHTDHPIYQAQMCIKRFTTDNIEEHRMIRINLPFTCSTAGFIDPLHDETDQETYDLGIFPLYNQSSSEDAPDPSTKFLHLSCEEIHKPKIEQSAHNFSFFSEGSNRKAAATNDDPPDRCRGTKNRCAHDANSMSSTAMIVGGDDDDQNMGGG
jgi:hypothetical protein